MSIATELQNYETYLTNAYTKAQQKNATIPQNKNLQNLTATINSLQANSVQSKDVDFIDYDGTILYSYTAQEFANLETFPTNPQHDGLTSQGWNWTLAEAKTYVASHGFLDIGQLYMPTDEKTHIYLVVDEEHAGELLNSAIILNGTAKINWGDGTADTEITGTGSLVQSHHTYTTAGRYCITYEIISGYGSIQNGSSYSMILTGYTNNQLESIKSMIKKIEIGKQMYIGNNAFYSLFDLETITLPATAPTGGTNNPIIGNNAFYFCFSLKAMVLPPWNCGAGSGAFYWTGIKKISLSNNFYNIGGQTFYYSSVLERVALPENYPWGGNSSYTFGYCRSILKINLTKQYDAGATITIGANHFYYCQSLEEIKFPGNVSTINSNAFRYCSSLLKLDFTECTAVPTLASTTTIGGTPLAIKIIVPDDLYEDWIVAQNWTTYASKIIKASEA